MTAFPTYSTGTVAVANGATAITGTGSNWTGANAKPGDDVVVDGNTVVVLDVTDATHLVIDAWPFTSVVAGASYKIIKRSPLRFVGGDAMADVSTLVAAINTDGFYVFVGPDLTEPDPSYGEEDQFAFQPSTSKLWLKTGGAWVLQGIFKGFNITGAWSGATAYAVGDAVSLAGTSYVALADSTNQTPPNATYWQVLAAKGDTGATGNTGAGYGGTSTTSLTIGTGSKAFTTQAGLAYLSGARVRASSTANTSNWMEGLVTYSGTTLTMTSDKTNGSGTIASWNLNVVGQPGAGDLSSANNLSDVASAATARTNLGAAASGTTISGGGLVTGGGDLSANRTVTVTAANQSDMETATSTTTAVTPSVQKHHPGHPKAWVCAANTGGTILASYGVSSISNVNSSVADINWSVAFSSANYCPLSTIYHDTISNQTDQFTMVSASSVRHECYTANTGAGNAPARHLVMALGDQ